jgi:hypothetical protein
MNQITADTMVRFPGIFDLEDPTLMLPVISRPEAATPALALDFGGSGGETGDSDGDDADGDGDAGGGSA